MPYLVEVRDHFDHVVESMAFGNELANALPSYEDAGYPVLRYLDEYGHTYFNYLQVRALVEELQLLARQPLGDAERTSLQSLERLARTALERPHRILTFVGD